MGVTRVAYAIPKRVGGAVVRNRIRRRLRAVVADLASTTDRVPDGVLLISVGPEAVLRSSNQLTNDVEGLLLALEARRSGGDR
jgi:ribonuclease P protein component